MTSTIKVDNIQKVSDGSNIIKKCGSTITLGSSGQTVAVACGATTSGMGRTGTVDWCTTAKTSPLTVASGNGYFINTSGGVITVTLPSSPSAGDIVAFKDYGNTWDTNNVTIGRNGSKINGECSCAVLNTESQSVTLIYVDGTKGWQDVNDSTANISGATYVAATGGTVTTSGDFKIHTFDSSATFCVSAIGNAAGSNTVDYVVVAGGAGAGRDGGGGGGAGGFRTNFPSCNSGLSVSVQGYPVTIGGGGNGAPGPAPGGGPAGSNGSNSIFSSITSAGGGGGGTGPGSTAGQAGGSGGGGGRSCLAGGAGNTPPVSPPQGNNGGTGGPNPTGGGGGGGHSAVGASGSGGNGGAGTATTIPGSPITLAGGGGGSGGPTAGTGGAGGGGAGDKSGGGPYLPAGCRAGTANTGGGGGASGGSCDSSGGGNGGSGKVVIRYKFQ